MKIMEYYSTRKMKKTRLKKKLSRAIKRGDAVYSGFISFTDELDLY